MTTTRHYTKIAKDLRIGFQQVQAAATLLREGATIPFISRYRKEATNSLDEVAVTAIRDQLDQLAALDKRRDNMLKSLTERQVLTDELQNRLHSAQDLTILEDIYLPFRSKRRTRSLIARERGLLPLAEAIFAARKQDIQPEKYINSEKEICSTDDALAGARDIIAEWISENSELRSRLRHQFATNSTISAKVIKKNRDKGGKFRDYFEYSEKIPTVPGHRLLAMFRGENEKVLRLKLQPDTEKMIKFIQHSNLCKYNAGNKSTGSQQLNKAMEDSYKRLICPSLENELRTSLKEKADKEAIKVFGSNMKELLLAPPLGQKRVMALDPGFRTGAKLVCLDEQGKLLHHTTIYPTQGKEQAAKAAETCSQLLKKFDIEAIGIGNGTASRETEQFVQKLIENTNIIITLVNEDGASIYSASDIARKEFPNLDLTVRGAISIGRRLQDPLAELVKLDPKSVGVGQYQHDVDQTALRNRLTDVVSSCVNSVGVELNTASPELLTYVSGLGPVLAQNIIQYRLKNGPFTNRKDLLKVTKLGPKAFEQCAGFLRIHGAQHPLDASGVHPERYVIVQKMADNLKVSIREIMDTPSIRNNITLEKYVDGTVGLPTLKDILAELAKPGRDPRPAFSSFSFAEDIHTVDDLEIGMRLPGIVTNVTKFGAFVDIGIHQDGLVHISHLANHYVKDPASVVSLYQHLKVKVIGIDKDRGRISLSLKES